MFRMFDHLSSKLLFFLMWGTLLSPLSCKKDDDSVPNVTVNILLSTTDPSFTDLNAVGGLIYLSGGSRGLVVYRLSMQEFMAYDRHCTYKPSESCAKVDVDASGIIAVDAYGGSK